MNTPRRFPSSLRGTIFALSFMTAVPCLPAGPIAVPPSVRKDVKRVIIIFQENRSFDAYYGEFPGANNLASAPVSATRQTDQFGTALPSLPQSILNNAFNVNGAVPPAIPSSGPDPRFPASLPNGPFNVQNYVAKDQYTGDMIHYFYTEQYQINDRANPNVGNDPKNQGGSPMSKFSWWSTNPGLVMGHYDMDDNDPEGVLAREFTLCDSFFHDVFGGSFLNHQWLIAARGPVWPASAGVPASTLVTQFDANGFPQQQQPKSNTNVYGTVISQAVSDKALSNDPKLPGFPMSNTRQALGPGDYWAINTIYPLKGPHGGFSTADVSPTGATSQTASDQCLALQTHDTIGDRMLDAGRTWKWYAGGWNDAKAGRAGQRFQFHHQPFVYFQKYALAKAPVPQTPAAANSPNPYQPAVAPVPGVDSPGSAAHLKDIEDFWEDLTNNTLPELCFIKAYGADNGHNAYSNLAFGDNFVANVVNRIRATPEVWKNCVIFVTNDEHGGIWDHVTPPQRDGWGPGSRVPLLVISPFAKNGFIDHTPYTTSSLLAFIEGLWGLQPLNTSDANALPPVSPFRGQPDLIIPAQRGQPLNYQLPAYNNPTHYKAIGGFLPAYRLEVNPQTGLLSGTPNRKGTIDFRVRVSGNPTIEYSARLVIQP